jgi:hypothetical protein
VSEKIPALNTTTFSNANLNLLFIFAVLMRERSVTRTSEILMLSQPDVSYALKQLRSLLGDELFTRGNNRFNPHRACLFGVRALVAISRSHRVDPRRMRTHYLRREARASGEDPPGVKKEINALNGTALRKCSNLSANLTSPIKPT